MINAVTTGLTTVIGWVGTVVTSLTSTTGDLKELLPLFAVGIACSAMFLAVKGIRSLAWGA